MSPIMSLNSWWVSKLIPGTRLVTSLVIASITCQIGGRGPELFKRTKKSPW